MHTCGGQRSTWRSQFSCSTIWILGLKLRSLNWWHMLSPTEPSHKPRKNKFFLSCLWNVSKRCQNHLHKHLDSAFVHHSVFFSPSRWSCDKALPIETTICPIVCVHGFMYVYAYVHACVFICVWMRACAPILLSHASFKCHGDLDATPSIFIKFHSQQGGAFFNQSLDDELWVTFSLLVQIMP